MTQHTLIKLFQLEDEKEHIEKELEVTKLLLTETADEKKRLEVETDQLKSLLKREVAHFDSEMVRLTLECQFNFTLRRPNL